MASLYQHSDASRRQTWLLMFVFCLFIVAVGYVLSLAQGDYVWLIAAAGLSFGMSFLSYWQSDKLVLAMSRAKEADPNQYRELYRLVENLCITAGLPRPKIYIIDDSAPNAFATGRNPKHAALAFTSGLLAKLDKAELEGVIAHELSHVGNRDILLATMVTVLVGLVVLLADWFRHSMLFSRRGRDENGGQAQAIFVILAIILSLLAPLFASLMQLAISRKREFAADSDGALLTRYPEGLARALEKISADSEPLEAANRATAHLYIASPFKDREGRSWLARAFMTHPPVAERIRRLRESNIN